MKIYLANEYTKHGCNIKGNLVIAEYWDDMKEKEKTLPLNGFGSMLVFDFAEQALAEIQKTYPNAKIVFSIPDLVCRI